MNPTEVILTVDIEFSIAGAFTDPSRYRPVGPQAVLGSVDGHHQGLGCILRTLARHGATATFFIETMNTTYFGLEPMGEIARTIHQAGHDVQIHVHPCWTAFADGPYKRSPGEPPPNDACGSFDVDGLERLLRRAIAVFEAWGLPRPVALRTGGFSTSPSVYAAQARVGIPLASNVCVAVAPPQETTLQVCNGRHRFDGVLEIPTLSFDDKRVGSGEHLRPFQINAISASEMVHVMDRVHEAQVSPLVATTHAFEFFKRRGLDYEAIRPNRINQHRLERLCSHVANHPDRFRWGTFGGYAACAKDMAEQDERPVQGTAAHGLMRMVQNAINDRVWWI